MSNFNKYKELSEDKINDVLIYLKTIRFQNCEYRYDKFYFNYPDQNIINRYVAVYYDEFTYQSYISTIGTTVVDVFDMIEYSKQLDESINIIIVLNSLLEK